MKHLFTLLLSLFTLAWAADTSYTATCSRVYDGDTFVASKDNTAEEIKIRLYGIDAPEKGQPYADKASKKLLRLVHGKQLRILVTDTDRYGRSVCKVYAGNTYVNLEMVRSGYAWHYKQYAAEEADLAKAEKNARKSRKGLWKEDNPTEPSVWRKGEAEAHKPALRTGSFTGTCTEVKDGEEFFLLTGNGEKLHIYLNGTDAPENAQDTAICNAARQKLQELILNKELRVEVSSTSGTRHYATVYAGELYINAEMVRSGLTWYSSMYAPDDTALKKADKAARKAKRGIWAASAPVPPWKWRKANKMNH